MLTRRSNRKFNIRIIKDAISEGPEAFEVTINIDTLLPKDVNINVGTIGSTTITIVDTTGECCSSVLTVLCSHCDLSTVLATITQHPNSTVVYEGTPVTLSCEATASGPITYQWRRSSGRISNEAIGVTTPTLTIPSVRQDDEDEYYCTASYGVYRNGTNHTAKSERAKVVVFGMNIMCTVEYLFGSYKYQVELVECNEIRVTAILFSCAVLLQGSNMFWAF